MTTTTAETDMPKKSKATKNADGGDSLFPYVLVDYSGSVGSAKGQRPVKHERSPYVFFYPEQDRSDIALNPGLNLVDREQWDFYSEHPGQFKTMVAQRKIRKMKSLPRTEGDLTALIERTIDPKSLEWMSEQIKAIEPDEESPLFGMTDESKRILLNLIASQLKSKTSITIEPKPWRVRVPLADTAAMREHRPAVAGPAMG